LSGPVGVLAWTLAAVSGVLADGQQQP
jgi:hypothetical protein